MKGTQPPDRRRERLADRLRRQISEALLYRVQDPRIGFVTVTGVELSRDLRIARVFTSVLGDEKRAAEALAALDRAKGFLGRELFRALRLKAPLELRFELDESAQQAARIEALLRNLKDEEPTEETE